VTEVFLTMLDMEVIPVDGENFAPIEGLTATIQFLGESAGAALVHCSREQAKDFTSRLLGEKVEDVNDDVRDVLGELANVIGGNLKSLFSPGMSLSLPLVLDGGGQASHLCDFNRSTTVAFDSGLGLFHVTMVRTIKEEIAIN
jgi:chemotaxis protein CheX